MFYEQTSFRDIKRMVERLGARYVVVPVDFEARFLKPKKRFQRYFKRVGRIRSSCRIYEPRRPRPDHKPSRDRSKTPGTR
jgi:hypothetical protein